MDKDYEILKDVVKFLEKRCKEQQQKVDELVKKFETPHTHLYEDEDEWNMREIKYEKGKLQGFVQDKISVEKYYKKLKHEATDVE